MILTAKLKNKTTPWSAQLKPRISDSVTANGDTYINISGINSDISNTTNWFKVTNNSYSPILINKVASDISGSADNYYIDLSTSGMPVTPASIMVYVTSTGLDADFLPIAPVNYNPVTKILYGMINPTDFPDQKVKISVL